MITAWVMALMTERKRLVIAAAAFLILALFFFRMKTDLRGTVVRAQKEYRTELDLSKNKARYAEIFQRMTRKASLPKGAPLDQTAWIQSTQALIGQKNLTMRDLSPLTSKGKRGKNKVKLMLTAEGKMTDWMNFIYALASSQDWVYVENLNMTLASPDAEMVRGELTLSQS